MDRVTTYYGQLARETDVLLSGQNAMVALGMLARATLGTGTLVDGFTLVPTAPASLSASLTAGQVYQAANLESSSWSSLGADTRSVMKQGLMLDATSLTFTPPATPGYAQSVLVEVQYQDLDDGNTVLPYYNASNPSVPFSGPANNGSAQSTRRRGVVAIQLKYGVAATSGTQVIPTPDAGWAGLFVVTLAFGQTSITAGNIVQYSGAPFVNAKLGTIPAFVALGQVQRLVTNPIYWVRPDGNDVNDGSANDSSHAFATIAGALAATAGFVTTGVPIVINLGVPGTYASPGQIQRSSGTISIVGNAGSPSSYIISGAGSASQPVITAYGCALNLSGVTVSNTGTVASTVGASAGGSANLNNVTLTSAAGNNNFHLATFGTGSILVGSGVTIASGMGGWLFASGGVISLTSSPITFSGTPAWSVAGVVAASCGQIGSVGTPSFSGSATGSRYLVTTNAVVNTNGGGANFYPGSTAGSTATGGQYA